MFGFGKRKVADPPPPVGLDDLHSYASPPAGHYPSAQPTPAPTYATQLGIQFPDIPNQDRILVHWDRPPDGESPDRWYQDRDSDKAHRLKVEQVKGSPFSEIHSTSESAADPRWVPVHPSRITNYLIPTNGYVYQRPYDQDVTHELNGVHFSMADNRRSYAVGGMNPVHRGRNTYRVDPPTLDATMVDLDNSYGYSPPSDIFVSPQATGSVGRSYRLGQ